MPISEYRQQRSPALYAGDGVVGDRDRQRVEFHRLLGEQEPAENDQENKSEALFIAGDSSSKPSTIRGLW